jgi:hypothetical protein
MGRLDIPDKQKDWVSVTREYLAELQDEIASLKTELEVERAGTRSRSGELVNLT